MAFDVRKWLYDQSTDFIPSFTPRERQMFTVGARIAETFLRVGSKLVLPGAGAVASVEVITAASAASVPRYGIRRIGGRMLGTTFGALMVAEAMMPTLMRFQPEQRID